MSFTHTNFFHVPSDISDDYYTITINYLTFYKGDIMKKTRTWKLLMLCIIVILGVCNSASISISRTYGSTENTVDYLSNDTKIIGKIDDTTEQIITDCNNAIYNYFSVINIDVSYDLYKIDHKVFLFEESESSDFSLLGYYDSLHPCHIYLNNSLLEDIDKLKFTYIHEVMHYLGVIDDDTTMLMEGMADAITEDILGYYYKDSYDVPRALCNQLLIADPNVIQFIINGGDLDDKIDNRLKCGNPSYILDYNLTEIEYGGLDTTTYDNYVDSCQEIISSYCDTFYLTDEQYEEIKEYILF